jgi:methionine synthase II (cobalamin-independent)
MPGVEFKCLPTIIGSMPQKDAAEACRQILHYLKDIPAWPQLPKLSFMENMYVQFSQGFPGVVVRDNKIFVDRSGDINGPLEQLYSAYLENKVDKFPVTRDRASGLYEFLAHKDLPVKAVKGQIVGPVTWGMTVTDNDGRAIAYDDVLADACARLLKLKAAWMERELKEVSRNTLIFVDEPYLSSYGSSFFALNKEKVVSLIEEVLSGISGLKGVHCCGNTDWSLLLGTRLDILSFDAYGYAESLTLYPQEVKKFISRGGVIAWGIVPNEESLLAKETVASLKDRLENALAPFSRQGTDIPFRRLIAQGLLTPSCGLDRLSPEAAGVALELLSRLSEKVREKWG